MKHLLIILSLTIAAFIAACGDVDTRTALSKGATFGGDLEKASSDEELLSLKKQLETKKAQVPEIINSVKKRFGNVQIKKSKELKKNADVKIQEKVDEKKSEEKIKNPGDEFKGKELISRASPEGVSPTSYRDLEVKSICINTCDIQIIVERKVTQDNKTESINAFVVVRIKRESLEVDSESKTNKTFEYLDASYDVKSNAMKLSLKMDDKKGSQIKLENFSYSATAVSGLKFKVMREGKLVDRGTLDVYEDSDVRAKTMELKFEISKESILIFILEDYGLFGKHTVDEVSATKK